MGSLRPEGERAPRPEPDPEKMRTLVLADLHLVGQSPKALGDDLAALVAAHPGARIVVVGDLFDLPSEMPNVARDRALASAMSAQAHARAALAQHVDRGGELWLVSGNHDAEVGAPDFRDALAAAFGVDGEARGRIRTTPWFFRDGGLHLEHGHVFDPDNAPAHPLVLGARSLGTHFVEELIAPTGAHRYLNANDQTPLTLLASAFAWYGVRGPYVIYRYFHAAITAMAASGPFYRGRDERGRGEEREPSFAEEHGIPRALVRDLVALGAEPTMASFTRTFARMYFDRVIATLSLLGGLGASLAGRPRAGAGAFAFGAALMAASWAQGHNRYAGTVADRLRDGAAAVREATGAALVIFGHTHREALEEGYANTGSFAFHHGSPGRPFLEIEGTAEHPRAVRRYWPASG
jgi:UDP-2,3-diacylglucosamine pyrophosphatase LpxH